MEDYGEEFPGFQTCVHKEELEYRRPLSRLQRRAPCQLQIKPGNNAPLEWKSDPKISSASAGTSSFDSFYRSKDPIPLLSPLVLPSLIESSYIQQDMNLGYAIDASVLFFPRICNGNYMVAPMEELVPEI